MKLWRTEDPEFAEDGSIITGGMFAHQRNFWGLNNFIKALVAGYGGGKTLIGGKRSTALALTNAPVPHLIISPSYKIARRTVIPTIEALLNGKRTLHPTLRYRYNKTDHEFKIKFRGRTATIWIASGDEPKSLKGPNIGSAWIDEPFIQAEEVLNEAIARIRDPASKIKELMLTGTPEELNWGYDICEGDRVGDYDIGLVRAHTRDNLALGTEYADSLENAFDDLAAQAYLGGEFVNLSVGRVYYGFNRELNVVDLPDPGYELGVGMDFNVNPMSAIVFWRAGSHMHVMDEIELPNADTYRMCDVILERYKFPDGSCRVRTIYPDATGNHRKTSAMGKTDFSIITDFGYDIDAPPGNPPVRDRENSVNGKFKPAKGEPTLTISPNCKKLIGNLVKYVHEKKHKKDHKALSHLIDALGYPVHRLFPIYKPTIQTGKLIGT